MPVVTLALLVLVYADRYAVPCAYVLTPQRDAHPVSTLH